MGYVVFARTGVFTIGHFVFAGEQICRRVTVMQDRTRAPKARRPHAVYLMMTSLPTCSPMSEVIDQRYMPVTIAWVLRLIMFHSSCCEPGAPPG